ncbi:MAG: hypothetical protein EON54_27950, partial [Alcaligenaceae bacterium]
MHQDSPSPPPSSTRITRYALTLCGAGVVCAGALGAAWVERVADSASSMHGMMIAPMIGVIEPCILVQPQNSDVPVSLAKRCDGLDGSAGALIDATLQDFSPTPPALARYPLGYTLPVPLLQLFKKEGRHWEIDQDMVKRLVHTIRDSRHPLVLYLFSTHFAAHAPIERELVQDDANLAQTREGPLGVDSYYDSSIYNWSFARTDNSITQRRLQAMHAVL